MTSLMRVKAAAEMALALADLSGRDTSGRTIFMDFIDALENERQEEAEENET